MRPFKFQWQKVKDEYFRPGFVSLSPQQQNKFIIQMNKNILGSLVINQTHAFRNDAMEDIMNII